MASFGDREKSFEDKFAHDEQLQFRVNNRRNKLLGLWAAGELGKSGSEAEEYAKEVVISDLQLPGDEDVVGKLVNDFKAAGLDISEHRIRRHMAELLVEAKQQIMNE